MLLLYDLALPKIGKIETSVLMGIGTKVQDLPNKAIQDSKLHLQVIEKADRGKTIN